MRREESKCLTPQQPPLNGHLFRGRGGEPEVLRELQASFDLLPPGVAKQRKGEFLQRLKAAERGELVLEEELKPVHRDPHLWEIRWSWDRSPWRLYHAEPAEAPQSLVLLRWHQKSLLGSASEIRTAQSREMDIAARRFVEGRSWRWGLA